MFGRHRIKLDPSLHEQAVQRAAQLGYSSVEEYVTHLIERDLRGLGSAETGPAPEVLERLRGLGYLDPSADAPDAAPPP
jgi:hypothetical protein